MKALKKLLPAIAIMLCANFAHGQLALNTTMTPVQLVQNVLVGTGVQISNISYTGDLMAKASFSNGGTTNIGLNSGIILTSGHASLVVGPNSSTGAGNNNGQLGDADLQTLIPGYTVNDASVLEFDFTPLSDTVEFRYVFGSDEYPEFVNSSFNDVFGFFITGPKPGGGTYAADNIAQIPGTTLPVTIDNVNNVTPSYPQYYVDNTGGLTIEYDGFTTVLTAWAAVIPCQSYHFKIAVGDAGDYILDSGVFLEANSFSTDAIELSTDYSVPGAGAQAIEGCNDAVVKFSVNKFATDTIWVYIDTIYGTATNGVDFPTLPTAGYILPGQKTGTITVAPFVDNLAEGTEYITLVIPTSPCTIDTLVIPIVDYIPITLTTSPDTLICQDSAMINVFPVNGGPPYNYIWSPSTDISNTGIKNPIVSPPTTTTYFVQVSDSTGCPPVYDSVRVTVSVKPNVSFLPDIFNGCEPLTVNFTDMSAPNIAGWNWDFGDGNNSSQQNPAHTYNAGNYTITLNVTTADGCEGTFAVPGLITAYPSPLAYFDPVPPVTTIDANTITFQDMSTNANTWDWDFGDPASGMNNYSTAQNPVHTYDSEGSFTVWLVVESANGCIDSVSRNVLVVVDSIGIPNIITPNGDGYNDQFVITNIDKIESSTLIIYNRWGKKIFEMDNYDNSWDGDNHPDGTYYFVLKYKTYFREDQDSGTITILRTK